LLELIELLLELEDSHLQQLLELDSHLKRLLELDSHPQLLELDSHPQLLELDSQCSCFIMTTFFVFFLFSLFLPKKKQSSMFKPPRLVHFMRI
jgi:hypothetical protein